MKRIVAWAVSALALAAFLAAPAAAAPMKVEHQIDILGQTDKGEDGWFVMPTRDLEWEQWCYAVTDLDHDGNLEILKAKRSAPGSAPELRCEELKEGKWERTWGVYYAGGTDIPDILTNAETASHPHVFHHPEENLYFYIFTDTRMNTEFASVTRQYNVCLNGDLQIEEMAFMTWQLSGRDGTETRRYYLPGWLEIEAESGSAEPPAKEIGEAEYLGIAKKHFPSAQESIATIKWIEAKDLLPHVMRGKAFPLLYDSYKAFS